MPSIKTLLKDFFVFSSLNCLLSAGSALAQKPEPLRFIVKVKKSALASSVLSELDVAGVNMKKRSVDIILNTDQMDALKKMNIPYEIVSAKNLIKRDGLQIDKRYQTPEQIENTVKELTAQHPNLVQSYVVGRSLMGKPLYGVKITDLSIKTPKPTVFFDGMHHAREVMSTEITTDILKTLTQNYATSSVIRDLLKKVEVWVIPQVNPDGNEIVWTKDNWWRKNARPDDVGDAYGVDPNRNYPFMWGGKCGGSSNFQRDDTYHGASALSEPESKTVFTLTKEINPVASISFHSYGEFIIGPMLCVDAPDKKTFNALGQYLVGLIPSDSGTGSYTYGQDDMSTVGYSVDGSQPSSLFAENGTFGFVLEMNEDFQPDYAKFRDPTVLKLRKAWIALINQVANGSQVRGTLKDAVTGANLGGAVYSKGENYTLYKHGRKISHGLFQKLLLPGQHTLIFESPEYKSKEVNVIIGNSPVDLQVTLSK